jgi:hypothetical protein
MEEAAQSHASLAVFAYLGAYIWAIGVSGKRWMTLMWMFLSLVVTWFTLLVVAPPLAELIISKTAATFPDAWRLVNFLSALMGGDPNQAWEDFGAGSYGTGVARLFTVPSFVVPAVVGAVHARRNRRSTTSSD